jgi:IS5 family transposase
MAVHRWDWSACCACIWWPNWFNLADEACEDALYDIACFRDFCRIDLGRERVPDATTLLNFRHLLEQHQLGAALFAKVGELLLANGMKLSGALSWMPR